MRLEGTSFQRNVDSTRNSDYTSLADDGLVLINIEKKREQLGVIKGFISEYDLDVDNSNLFVNELECRLMLAESIRKYQEHLKS